MGEGLEGEEEFFGGGMRLICALALVGCHGAVPDAVRPAAAISAGECGEEIFGLEQVARAPVVLLGEMHGIEGPPQFALDLACRLALRQGGATLALEISQGEQARIDSFLASNGDAAARAALLAGEFWTRKFQDGRSSVARLQMFEKARQLIHSGVALGVSAVDQDRGHPGDRDRIMGDSVVALARQGRGPVVMLAGNNHIITSPAEKNQRGMPWMGAVVRQQIPEALGLDNRYGAGEAWIMYADGDPPQVKCGRQPIGAQEPGTRWGIQLFATPDANGIHGSYDVGPARASDPAVPNPS
jgi:hypothetical protein